MTDKFLVHILSKCGVKVQQDTNGNCYYFTDITKEQLTEDEAMELVENYLVSAIANRLETGKVDF